jgi:aprataxin
LQQTYENVFSAFVDICKSVEPKKQTEERLKTTETNITFPLFDAPPVAFGTTKGGSWDNALITIANTLSSETNKRRTFYVDDKIAIVYDPYAKAKMHLLCIYRSNIDNPTQLKTEHVELLKHAHTIAKQVAAHLRVDMMIGYHAIPSMRRLHFHIISRDLVSDCIKNKKHYNSFATDFFLPCDKVLTELESKGKVTIDKTKYENLLKNDLKCHRCKSSQKNIPKLKEHLEQCNK